MPFRAFFFFVLYVCLLGKLHFDKCKNELDINRGFLIFKELASARSNGALFVSAIDPIKKIRNTGNKGTMYQTALWDSIITVISKLPANKITINIAELKINS